MAGCGRLLISYAELTALATENASSNFNVNFLIMCSIKKIKGKMKFLII